MARRTMRATAAEPKRVPAEYHDEYSETLGTEFRKLQDALLSDTVSLLPSSELARIDDREPVARAVAAMLAGDRTAVVAVGADGRLTGILTDRDVLARVLGAGHDPERTAIAEVMTGRPEALRPDDRICYAVNRMMTLGCRTMPLVDGEGRPVGLITVGDIVKWLSALFPEAILNLRPGDRLKKPDEIDGG